MTKADPHEEPCARKPARTVLQTSGGSDPFAEFNHAIKAFAALRKNIDGMSTGKGIREYLILLSIYETCQYKGVGFLDFLRSGETDIDGFFGRQHKHHKGSLPE
jgi:hypothetical protein